MYSISAISALALHTQQLYYSYSTNLPVHPRSITTAPLSAATAVHPQSCIDSDLDSCVLMTLPASN